MATMAKLRDEQAYQTLNESGEQTLVFWGTCTLTLITIIGLVMMMACWTLLTLTLINWARLRIVTVGIGVMVTVVAVDAAGIKRLKIS